MIPTVGLLTKTAVHTPAVRWIIPLRHRDFGLLQAHVSADRIHIFATRDYDDIQLIGTRQDFGYERIRGTCALIDHDFDQSGVKVEEDLRSQNGRGRNDLLVINLGSRNLLLCRCIKVQEWKCRLDVTWTAPLPFSNDPLRQFGDVITADSTGQAIVLAAPECLTIFSAKSSHDPVDGLDFQPPTFIEIVGHIQHAVFLRASTQADHLALVLVTVVARRPGYQILEWTLSDFEAGLTIHERHRLDLDGGFPGIACALTCDSDVLVATDRSVFVFSNLLSGSPQRERLKIFDTQGISQKKSWTCCQSLAFQSSPKEPQQYDFMLSGSDGTLATLSIDKTDRQSSKFDARILCALPMPLDQPVFPYLSHGARSIIVTYGTGSQGGIFEVNEEGDCHMIQVLGARAPVLDVFASSLLKARDTTARTGDAIFCTSGSGSNGCMTELRPGGEARILLNFDLEIAQSLTKAWSVALPGSNTPILVTTGHDMNARRSTRVAVLQDDGILTIDAAIQEEALTVQELSDLDLYDPTIDIAQAHDGRLIQVTSKSVNYLTSQSKSVLFNVGEEEDILQAFVCWPLEIVTVVVSRTHEPCNLLVQVSIASTDSFRSIQREEVQGSVTALAVFETTQGLCTAIALAAGSLKIRRGSEGWTTQTWQSHGSSSALNVCEALLPVHVSSNQEDEEAYLLCALRSGQVEVIPFGSQHGPGFSQTISLGVSGVGLSSYEDRYGCQNILASCGSCLYHISPGEHSRQRRFEVKPIYLTDNQRPEFEHMAISAVEGIRHDFVIGGMNLAGSVIVIMDSSCFIASLDETTQLSVPRSLPVTGSPVRAIWSAQLRHFVVAGIEHLTQHGSGENQFRSFIEFRLPVEAIEDEAPPTKARRAKFVLQASERIFAIEEWIYIAPDNRRYAFILVGTGLEGRESASTSDRKRTKGRVHVLQTVIRTGPIESVTLAASTKFEDPVYSIRTNSNTSYICGHGNHLSFYSYDASQRKWRSQCTTRLTSPALHITTTPPKVHVTTARDSLMTFTIKTGDDHASHRFVREATDTASSPGQHHLTLPTPFHKPTNSDVLPHFNILATKTGQIRGLLAPAPTISTGPRPFAPLFSAHLPSVLVRIVSANLSPDPLVPQNAILGTSIDGAVYGLQLLPPQEWAVLKFVEHLCHRSRNVCPFDDRHLQAEPFRGDGTGAWKLPLGLKGLERYDGESGVEFEGRTGLAWDVVREALWKETKEKDEEMEGVEYAFMSTVDVPEEREEVEYGWERFEVLERSERWKEGGMQVDGDVLGSLLEIGGEAMLSRLLEEEATREDQVGVFVREHLGEDLSLVADTVDLIDRRMHGWGYW